MSFWGNDDQARAREQAQQAQRKEEERRKVLRDEKAKADKAAAARAAAKIRAKKLKTLKAERDAEDKKLRDELVEKMTNGGQEGKDKRSTTTFPTLNRGFGGDRVQPTNQQQCFQHLKQPGSAPQIGYSREALDQKARENQDGEGKKSGGGSSGPPLRRPF